MDEMKNLIRRLNLVYGLYEERRLTTDDMAYIVGCLLRDYHEREKEKEVNQHG